MNRRWRRAGVLLLLAMCLALAQEIAPPLGVDEVRQLYAREVDRRLDVPREEASRYAALAQAAFDRSNLVLEAAQYVLAVDRDPWVQAALLFWRSRRGEWLLVGASPVSTGLPGTVDHFETPAGVFPHDPANLDFRSRGTPDAEGIRGWGREGLRVFDLGWQRVPKGWGDGLAVDMLLQLHATDPDVLEPRLGTAQSRGGIRIPATLDAFLDRHGLLDADYLAPGADPRVAWVLAPDRDAVQDPGRYVVVVDSQRQDRPEWSPIPWRPHRSPAPVRR